MLIMSMMTLVACGGGDGDLLGGDDDGGTTPDAITLTIAKVTEGDLSLENDISLTATVLQGGGALANKTVTFTLAFDGTAILDPIAGTATTDENGNATIVVKVSDIEGSVNVIATHESASDDISFNSLGDGVKVVDGEPEAASIQLFSSSPQLASSGAQTIDLFVIAKDENNILLEGVTINFSTTSGALTAIVDANGNRTNVTGPDGKVGMSLSTLDEPDNRTIVVTVTTGDISESLEIDVIGTTITLTGSSALALNDEASYIVNVLDSDGNGIAKTEVALSVGAGDADVELPTPATVTTDAEGQATIKVTGVSGGSNSIVAQALGASVTKNVSVQADSFLFTNFTNGADTVNPSVSLVTPDVSLQQTASATLTWQRSGVPVVGKNVSYSTTRGNIAEGIDALTDANGQVSVNLTSSNAGIALLTFVGNDTDENIELTNQLEFEFYADTAATLIAQASPNSIGPNQQTSTISVVVRDDNGNLVKNKTVKFEVDDISSGGIFPATAVTDSNGSASTVYTSNNTSAQNGITITATVIDTPSVLDTVELTVADRELFITLGTGNSLEELDDTVYIKEYSVFVTDVDSNPVANVDLTISLIPQRYYKGYWARQYDGDQFQRWVRNAIAGDIATITPVVSCENEDINFNGILDAGEDTNDDGMLTPGNVVSALGSITTDDNGRAIVQIRYGQSYGRWVDINLIASAKVTGSESFNQAIFTLPVSVSDITDEDTSPPTQGVDLAGPFGGAQNCNVAN
jgi:hypothetical protein